MTPKPSAIRTPRLLLRLVTPEDAQPTAALVTPDVAANLSTWSSPMSRDQALQRIYKSREMRDRREAIDFAIVDRQTDCLIGWIGLAKLDESAARLGYWLGTPFRSRGLMKEAAAAAIPAGAKFLSVVLVQAFVLKGNGRSIAVLESLGFRLEGEETMLFENRGCLEECLRYSATLPLMV